jgi:hypothetical protein
MQVGILCGNCSSTLGTTNPLELVAGNRSALCCLNHTSAKESAEEMDMKQSKNTVACIRWLAPALLAVAIMSSQTAQAAETTGSPDIVTAPQASSDSPGLVAALSGPGDGGVSPAERAVRVDGPSTQVAAKLERVSLQYRRERPRHRREAAAFSWRRFAGGSAWHRFGGGVGLVLGVGF